MFFPLQIQTLNSSGQPTATYTLPMPSKGYPKLSWTPDNEVRRTIPQRGLRVRVLGWIPVLKVQWKYYHPKSGQASFDTLLGLLGQKIRVGDGVTWMNVEHCEGPGEVFLTARTFPSDVSITFHGRDSYASRGELNV